MVEAEETTTDIIRDAAVTAIIGNIFTMYLLEGYACLPVVRIFLSKYSILNKQPSLKKKLFSVFAILCKLRAKNHSVWILKGQKISVSPMRAK